MKNVLMTIFTMLLTALTIILMIKGISIGQLKILSVAQIIDESKELSKEIQEANTLNNVTYKKSLSDLNSAIQQLSSSKSDYLDVASVSTDAEIKEANQSQTYSMEYLWSQVGNHATAEGVNLKLEVKSTGVDNKNNLNFSVIGSYMGIRNFIYSIENDSDLNFKIEGFKLTSGSDAEKLSCTFSVSDIAIKQENVTVSTSTSTNSNTDANNITSNNTTTNATSKNNISSSVDSAVQ